MAWPREVSCFPTKGMLFSAWQATTQALQPVQAFKSIAMPHAYSSAGYGG